MILFVGQVASDQRDREAFQEVDYRQMFGPGTLGMAKWVGEVARAPTACPSTWRVPSTPRCRAGPGPVVLVLPEDMLTHADRGAGAAARRAGAGLAGAGRAARPARAAAGRAAAAASSPAAAAGTPRRRSALQRFAENWQLPVGCGFRFQDTFDNRHPLYAGDVGIGINPKLAARVREADLILALGVRLGEMTTGGYTLLRGAAADAEAGARACRRRGTGPRLCRRPAAAGLDGLRRQGAGDAGRAARACRGRPGPQAAHADYEANLVAAAGRAAGPGVVMKTVQRLAPADTVYTNGAGNFSGWLHRYVRYSGLQHHGRTQLAPTSGAMGYGVPAAVAAALLYPQRTVVNVAGDGDFLMTGQELATATGYGAGRGAGKLISIVVDNGSYGTIRMHQEREYPGRVSGSDLFNPDFAALARGLRLARGARRRHRRSSSRRSPRRWPPTGRR